MAYIKAYKSVKKRSRAYAGLNRGPRHPSTILSRLGHLCLLPMLGSRFVLNLNYSSSRQILYHFWMFKQCRFSQYPTCSMHNKCDKGTGKRPQLSTCHETQYSTIENRNLLYYLSFVPFCSHTIPLISDFNRSFLL